jgi:hypothetical protein
MLKENPILRLFFPFVAGILIYSRLDLSISPWIFIVLLAVGFLVMYLPLCTITVSNPGSYHRPAPSAAEYNFHRATWQSTKHSEYILHPMSAPASCENSS